MVYVPIGKLSKVTADAFGSCRVCTSDVRFRLIVTRASLMPGGSTFGSSLITDTTSEPVPTAGGPVVRGSVISSGAGVLPATSVVNSVTLVCW